VELLIAVNPDSESSLKYLMRLPLAGGMVFRTSGTWPRTTALYCHPAAAGDWPADRLRPSMVADNLAEVQVRWPNVPIVFCETRPLAEEWTYRFLAAARAWAETEAAVSGRMPMEGDLGTAPVASAQPRPSSAEVRAWAALDGLAVPARGKLGREVWDAWHAAHPDPSPERLSDLG